MIVIGGPIAQLDRAAAFEADGREFESLWGRHCIGGSSPETWVTECTGYIGDNLGPKGLSSGSNTRVSKSK
jgi:hypothetical protein